MAKDWLKKQAIWQIYLPAPRHIPRPKFDIRVPNEVHQADLLFLPLDRVGRRTYKYALTDRGRCLVVQGGLSRWPQKRQFLLLLPWRKSTNRGPLKWPKLLQVDPGREFMGAVSQLLAKHKTKVRRGRVDVHRDQGIVERWNRTLAERLFGHQYAQEMRLPEDQRSMEWVKRLPAVVSALEWRGHKPNREKSPWMRSRENRSTQKPSSTVPGRPVGLWEQKLPSGVGFRYLYQPGELEGGRRRATDPVWSLRVYRLGRSVTKARRACALLPVLYYLDDGPARGFVSRGAAPGARRHPAAAGWGP